MADAQSLDFDFNTLPQIGNGWLEGLSRIREADPMFWSDHQQGYLVTRHADVKDGFGGNLPLSTARLTTSVVRDDPERAALFPTLLSSLPDWIINSDPPSHTRMRRLMGKAFNRRVVESVRTFAQGNIESLLDEMQDRGEAEVNEDLARIITGRTILHLLGVPQEYLPRLREWGASVAGALAVAHAGPAQLQAAERATIEMFDLFSKEIEKRRTAPRDDIFTGLVEAIDDGDKLTMEEMVGSSVVLLLAGHDTTLNSMVLGVETLSRHPEHAAWIGANPDKIENAVVEMMRYFAMAGGQTRIVSEDFEWHGRTLKAGEIVYLMIAGANRDPRVFVEPEKLDFSRDTFASMTFAPGIHHCIGHILARMQLNEFFSRTYGRFEQLEVIEPAVTFSPIWVFRSIPNLAVRFHPRKA
jgi:cytochrome P450